MNNLEKKYFGTIKYASTQLENIERDYLKSASIASVFELYPIEFIKYKQIFNIFGEILLGELKFKAICSLSGDIIISNRTATLINSLYPEFILDKTDILQKIN